MHLHTSLSQQQITIVHLKLDKTGLEFKLVQAVASSRVDRCVALDNRNIYNKQQFNNGQTKRHIEKSPQNHEEMPRERVNRMLYTYAMSCNCMNSPTHSITSLIFNDISTTHIIIIKNASNKKTMYENIPEFHKQIQYCFFCLTRQYGTHFKIMNHWLLSIPVTGSLHTCYTIMTKTHLTGPSESEDCKNLIFL